MFVQQYHKWIDGKFIETNEYKSTAIMFATQHKCILTVEQLVTLCESDFSYVNTLDYIVFYHATDMHMTKALYTAFLNSKTREIEQHKTYIKSLEERLQQFNVESQLTDSINAKGS